MTQEKPSPNGEKYLADIIDRDDIMNTNIMFAIINFGIALMFFGMSDIQLMWLPNGALGVYFVIRELSSG